MESAPPSSLNVETNSFNWSLVRRKLSFGELGLVVIILALGIILWRYGGTHADRTTGKAVSNFLNLDVLIEIATNASFFAVMAVGMTAVIVSAGIDLSVGSIYAMCGVITAMVTNAMVNAHMTASWELITVALICSLGLGLLAGLINGIAIVLLDVHPFIITLGTLWVFRGFAFVISKANSIVVPDPVVHLVKATLGLGEGIYPVPTIVMIATTILGGLFLSKTPMGRRIFAAGGNLEASRYAGLPTKNIIAGVYVLTGLCAGLAAFVGISYYGSASSSDASGYELFVIASAVVGGASLSGGKGTALGAMLGAILIEMIRESIVILHLDSNFEQIIVGIAIIVAVVLDRVGAKARLKRLTASSASNG